MAAGGYNGPDYTGTVLGSIGCSRGVVGRPLSRYASLFTVSLSSNNRRLMILVPGEGELRVVNLAGRQIVRYAVSAALVRKSWTVSLPGSFPAGLYVVGYSGVTGSMERVVPVF